MAERVATRTEEDVVRCEVRIDATPETVFQYFTDPEKLCRWMGTEADLDPVPGGALRVNVQGEHVARGAFVEVDPPRRVVFTWGWEGEGQPVPPGASTVEVTLTPEGEGTLVVLVHRDLPSDEMRTAHAEGWTHYVERLAVAAAGADPGPDPWGVS